MLQSWKRAARCSRKLTAAAAATARWSNVVNGAVAGGRGEKVGHYTALRYEWVDGRER